MNIETTDAKGFGLKWAGKLYGTNTGNLYIDLEKSDGRYSGMLRLNDDNFGLVIFDVTADYEQGKLSLSGTPKLAPEGIASGKFTARAGWVFMEPGTSENAFEPLREAAMSDSVITHPALVAY